MTHPSLPKAFPKSPNVPQTVVKQTVTTVTTTTRPAFSFKAKKAGTKGNHVYLILDESGSMSSFRLDTIGGVNSLIKKQKEDNDDTRLTIVKFEGGHIRVVYDNVDIKTVGEFNDYSPRGGTNLLDAVGFVLNKVNTSLNEKKKRDRPSIFIQIVTDGEENSSRNFNKDEIKSMISQTEEADWVVSYVGANVDAFGESRGIGISAASTSNFQTRNLGETFDAMSTSLSRMKGLRSSGQTVTEMYATGAVYTTEEKTKMEK